MSISKKIAITLMSVMGVMFLFVSGAYAQDTTALEISVSGTKALAAAIAISIAAAGCGLAQGRAGAAALEGIARNPGASGKIFTPMILCLALIESLAIYALLIAFVVAP